MVAKLVNNHLLTISAVP